MNATTTKYSCLWLYKLICTKSLEFNSLFFRIFFFHNIKWWLLPDLCASRESNTSRKKLRWALNIYTVARNGNESRKDSAIRSKWKKTKDCDYIKREKRVLFFKLSDEPRINRLEKADRVALVVQWLRQSRHKISKRCNLELGEPL